MLVSGCAISVTEQAARAGYWMAMSCSGVHNVPYNSIKRVIVNDSMFTITINGRKHEGILGFADFNKNQILVVAPYKDSPQLWGHEYLHMLPRIEDHPDSLFTRCNLR